MRYNIAIISACLIGCSSLNLDSEGFAWEFSANPVPQQAWTYYYDIDPKTMSAVCNNPEFQACAIIVGSSSCTIFLPKQGNLIYLKAHEERHCMGWRHP